MSVLAYVGLPGSGKTYSAVEHQIIAALKVGRPVVTNVMLRPAEVHKQYPSAVIEELPEASDAMFDKVPNGALVVIDEAWRIWPSGTLSKQLPEPHKAFFAEHRHKVDDSGRSVQIVLVTQGLEQIATFMRNLVETTFRLVKLTKVGQEKNFRCEVYEGAVTGPKPPASALINKLFGSYKPAVYDLYQSHTQSSKAAGEFDVDEKTLDNRRTVFSGMGFKATAAGVALVLAVGLFVVTRYFSGASVEEQPVVQALPVNPRMHLASDRTVSGAPVAPAPQTVVIDAEPEELEPLMSTYWRLSGIIIPADPRKARVAITGGGLTRFIPYDGNCEVEEGTDEHVCLIDGQIVTSFSGDTVRGHWSVKGAPAAAQSAAVGVARTL